MHKSAYDFWAILIIGTAEATRTVRAENERPRTIVFSKYFQQSNKLQVPLSNNRVTKICKFDSRVVNVWFLYQIHFF